MSPNFTTEQDTYLVGLKDERGKGSLPIYERFRLKYPDWTNPKYAYIQDEAERLRMESHTIKSRRNVLLKALKPPKPKENSYELSVRKRWAAKELYTFCGQKNVNATLLLGPTKSSDISLDLLTSCNIVNQSNQISSYEIEESVYLEQIRYYSGNSNTLNIKFYHDNVEKAAPTKFMDIDLKRRFESEISILKTCFNNQKLLKNQTLAFIFTVSIDRIKRQRMTNDIKNYLSILLGTDVHYNDTEDTIIKIPDDTKPGKHLIVKELNIKNTGKYIVKGFHYHDSSNMATFCIKYKMGKKSVVKYGN